MISKIRQLLNTKQASCAEITQKYLDAIRKTNESINAYVNVTEQEALEAARRVDEKLKSGQVSGLEGIPMTLKDNISTKDIETTCCSRILKGYYPIYDASVWEKLKAQNAVLLGKTNMDEFAMGSSCETSCFGGALNPHNTGHVSGGSSGGVASAVAANLAAYGLGSDTGGSIRQPAAFCGLVGLKPTYGAVSRYGLIAYASSLDQIGPIAHNVTDAAEIFDAISFYDDKDSTSTGSREKTADKLENDIKGKKIGIASEYFDGAGEEIKQAVMNAAGELKSQGAEIVEISIPSVKYALPVYYILACAEASSNLGRYDGIRYGYKTSSPYNSIHEMICKTRSEGFGSEVKRRILLGTYVLSSGYYDAYYKKAQNLRGTIVKAFDSVFETCDAILAPTVPATAFPCGFAGQDPVETYLTDICTVPVNVAGLPAVSLPCGFDSKGLPIGMQLIGNRFNESNILNIARKYEQATDCRFNKTLEMGVSL